MGAAFWECEQRRASRQFASPYHSHFAQHRQPWAQPSELTVPE